MRLGRKKTAEAAAVDIAAAAAVAAGKTNAGKVKYDLGAAFAICRPWSSSRANSGPVCAASGSRRSSCAFDDGGSSRIEEQKKETAYGHSIAYYIPETTERNGSR